MRTIMDLPDPQIDALQRYSLSGKLSRGASEQLPICKEGEG